MQRPPSVGKRRFAIAAVALAIPTVLAAWIYSRPPHPVAQAPSPVASNRYVDSAQCVTCHAGVAAGFRKTGMGQSFSRIRPQNKPGTATFYHKASDTHFAMLERGGDVIQRRWQIGFNGQETNVEEKRVDYVMGSGNHSRTFLHLTGRNTLQQLPLHWYAEKGGSWGMSPGYDVPDHPGSQRLAGYTCMFCHNAYPRVAEGHEEPGAEAAFLQPLPEGIDCQRCHGPGQRHIDMAAKPGATKENVRAAIVNPRRLTPERSMEVCMQCHLSTTGEKLPASVVRPDRAPFSYVAGEPLGDFRLSFDRIAGKNQAFENLGSAYRLRQSQCFLQSGGKLQCITCHNPHDIPRGPAATVSYNGKCRDCHPSLKGAQHVVDADCVSCHMQKRRTDDEVHVVMTDHLIRATPSRGLLAEKVETHETPATQYRGDVVLYYPPRLPDTPDNALALAVAQIRDRSNLGTGLPRLAALLETHRPPNARYYADLAEGYLASGDVPQAIRYFEEAVRRSRAPAFLLTKLGSALLESGNAVKAEDVLRRATTLAPADTLAWGMLGWALYQQGKTAEARIALEKAVSLDPTMPESHSNLGSMLAGVGDRAGAEVEFREAIRIQPGVAEWQSNLGGLLSDRGQLAEARYHFAQAVRLKPDDSAARVEYGRLLAATGDRIRAIEQFRIAAAGTDSQAAGEARQLLQKLGVR